MWFDIAFLIVALAAVYYFLLRPVLARLPALSALRASEASFLTALRMRFAGIKTVLLARANMGFMVVVAVHDYLMRNEFGIDWTPLTSHIPSWVMPIILAVDFWVIAKFREFTDQRQSS